MNIAPTVFCAPFSLLGFHHTEDRRSSEQETILAIMYDDDGAASHVLTTHTDYGITHCADGPVVRDAGAGCIQTDDNARFVLDRWHHRPDRKTRVWLHPHLLDGFSFKGQPITREEAAAMGWHQIDVPLRVGTPASYHDDTGNLDTFNPLVDTINADSIHYEWCGVCQEHYTTEGVCHHLKWADSGGGFCEGCGSSDVDLKEVRNSLHLLLKLLPPALVQSLYSNLLAGCFNATNSDDFDYRRTTFEGGWRANIYHRDIQIDHDNLLSDSREAEKLFWPGLAWLGSLDKPGHKSKTQAQYALTIGWFYEFLNPGIALAEDHLVLSLPRTKFEELFAKEPNDLDALSGESVIFKSSDLDRCRNSIVFAARPRDCHLVTFYCKDRYKRGDHRGLTYLVSNVEHIRPKGRRTTTYRLTLARCLEHDDTHPSALPTYDLLS